MHASSTAKSSLVTTSSASTPSKSASASALASTATATKPTVVDPNCEIEEISKKISEHADAIYRTWKCRGLAPTELLDFYTSAATTAGGTAAMATTDFFSSNASASKVNDETTSTEGLQKLVNAFVIKDKEQHKRANSGRTKSAILTQAATAGTPAATAMLKTDKGNAELLTKSSNIMKQAKPATQRPSAILLSDATPAATATAAKKSPTTTMTSTVGGGGKAVTRADITANKSACASKLENTTTNAGGGVAGGKTRKYAKPEKSAAATALDLENLELGLNLNLDLGLNLDVQNLTQLQTENLLKIKELLQQESKAAAAAAAVVTAKPKKTTTPTKIATAVTTVTTKAAQETQQQQIQKKQQQQQQPTAVKATIKASTNNSNDNATVIKTKRITAKAAATPATTTAVSDNVKIANNITSNNIADVAVANKNNGAAAVSTLTKQLAATATAVVNNIKSTEPREQQILATTANSNLNSNGNQLQQQQQKELKTKSKVIKNATSSSNDSSSSSSNINKTSVDNKTLKEKPTQQISGASNLRQQQIITAAATTSAKTNATAATATATSPTTATSPSAAAPSSAATLLVATAAANMEIARNTMPAAPTKIKTARPLTNGQDKNLGRPILTRGSVAERVLMFEKCPDVRTAFHNIKRPEVADTPPKCQLKVKLHSTPPVQTDLNSLQREIRAGKSVYIPRFYFPHGKPQPQIAIERTLRGILSAFDSFPNNQVTKDELPRILKLCGLPFYWRMPVMVFCQQNQSMGLVERQRFVEFWKQMNVYCHDNASRFVYILSRGQRFRSYILPEDLAPLVQDVVDTHPGLAFLKEATEFHSRYVHTVIARIFYSVNRSWSGKISISELKKSDLLEIISLLEEEDDINQIMAFFSYEHFYVIYCKFWELDRDHDLLINQEDLARHSDHALSTRIVERIFSGCVTRSDHRKDPDDEPKMSYTDFVWFLLSEEDKRTPTAIEYWFRCMDVDGDGVLSMYELEYFYEEQQQRMESIGIETLPFEDCLCQMLDMIKPQQRDCVTLGDLKRCKMTHVFFDTFFNLEKYLDHEQRDPFASQRDEYSSDWDRFAAQEYELLITEEND